MPDRPSLDDSHLPTLEPVQSQKLSIWDRLLFSKLGHRRNREEIADHQQASPWNGQNGGHTTGKAAGDSKPSRSVIPELPRPATFRRQDSEKRDKLLPHTPCVAERRTMSHGRKRASSALRQKRTKSQDQLEGLRRSAPVLPSSFEGIIMSPVQPPVLDHSFESGRRPNEEPLVDETEDDLSVPRTAPREDVFLDVESATDPLNDPDFREELAKRWILNLSMHFRDRSEREKFIVTFAERPTSWRRVTVSCDYRDAEPESLEANLKELGYQRDKNAYIYDAIRESLGDIKFYDTVTNLKLETRDKRLHVHVTEDVNEIVSYPPLSSLEHLNLRSEDRFRESSICFEAHQSGFVYKVSVHGKYYIKKEIPSPDTVNEFLYEINALTALRSSNHVIRFCGIVVDDNERLIKGILIDYAKQGALIDLIFDHDKVPLPWTRREKWAKQIIEGLQDIHEYGFVQGDFTLSNIVIDANDNAKIIDINRRGCPVGWEPPEFIGLITSGQRVSMYIGVKSDLYQLGMVLWGLAMLCDEPEREEGPLSLEPHDTSVPEFFRELVNSCLSDNPAHRMSARELLLRFPRDAGDSGQEGLQPMLNGITDNLARLSHNSNLSDGSEDMEEHRRLHPGHAWDNISRQDVDAVGEPRAHSGIDVSITAAGSHLELQGVDEHGQRAPVPDVLVIEEPPSSTLEEGQNSVPMGLPFLNRDPPRMDHDLPPIPDPKQAPISQSGIANGSDKAIVVDFQHDAATQAWASPSTHDQADTSLPVPQAQPPNPQMDIIMDEQNGTEVPSFRNAQEQSVSSFVPQDESQVTPRPDENPNGLENFCVPMNAGQSQGTGHQACAAFSAPVHQDSGFQDWPAGEPNDLQSSTIATSSRVHGGIEKDPGAKRQDENDTRHLTDQILQHADSGLHEMDAEH